MNYLNVIRKKLIEKNIQDIDIIIDIIEDVFPQNDTAKKTIDDLIRYAEKLYQKNMEMMKYLFRYLYRQK